MRLETDNESNRGHFQFSVEQEGKMTHYVRVGGFDDGLYCLVADPGRTLDE